MLTLMTGMMRSLRVNSRAQDDESNEGAQDQVEESDPEDEIARNYLERKNLYEAVKSGNKALVEDVLSLPDVDINMTWYEENLLMTAIRHRHQDIAEMLIDNGIDRNYTANMLSYDEEESRFDLFPLTCRQLAFEHQLWRIVDLIDYLNGELRMPKLCRALEARKKRVIEPRFHRVNKLFLNEQDIGAQEKPDEEKSVAQVSSLRGDDYKSIRPEPEDATAEELPAKTIEQTGKRKRPNFSLPLVPRVNKAYFQRRTRVQRRSIEMQHPGESLERIDELVIKSRSASNLSSRHSTASSRWAESRRERPSPPTMSLRGSKSAVPTQHFHSTSRSPITPLFRSYTCL